MKLHRWSSVPVEKMNARVSRQVIHARNLTLARIHLLEGAEVSQHSHPSEQITILQQGRLRFVVSGKEFLLQPGDMIEIPPDVPHAVYAVEESVAIDVFSPVREDWLRGEDLYWRS